MISKRWLKLAGAAIITSSCCCCCDAFAPPTHLDGNVLLRSHQSTASTTTRVYLFDLKQRLENQQRSAEQQLSRSRIPEEEIYYLSRGFGFSTEEGANDDPLELPYTIDLTTSPTRISPNPNGSNENQAAASKLFLRHLEVEDIKPILPEIVREFGAYDTPTSTGSKLGDELATWIENFLFSFTVLVGLDQRVERRKKGYGKGANVPPDHNVICLVEVTPVINNNSKNGNDATTTVSYAEQIVGIAELSWQPPDPTRNAPPFVLPYFAKDLISRLNNKHDEGKVPKGYVSNVLTWKNRRGLGYSRVLMAALEGIARRWGCDDIRLHVDADEMSGRIARGLYWSLGYEAVPDRGNGKLGYEWMGPQMANRGLYLVEGVPLLYLRKSLNEEDKMQ
jgi:GNAT superfamily N-acetyltransferase